MEFYLLNYFKPATYQQTELTRLGRALMDGFGCTSCHKATLVVEKDRRVADVETLCDAERGIFNLLYSTSSPLFVELATPRSRLCSITPVASWSRILRRPQAPRSRSEFS